jgi:hypothetical protein
VERCIGGGAVVSRRQTICHWRPWPRRRRILDHPSMAKCHFQLLQTNTTKLANLARMALRHRLLGTTGRLLHSHECMKVVMNHWFDVLTFDLMENQLSDRE